MEAVLTPLIHPDSLHDIFEMSQNRKKITLEPSVVKVHRKHMLGTKASERIRSKRACRDEMNIENWGQKGRGTISLLAVSLTVILKRKQSRTTPTKRECSRKFATKM